MDRHLEKGDRSDQVCAILARLPGSDAVSVLVDSNLGIRLNDQPRPLLFCLFFIQKPLFVPNLELVIDHVLGRFRRIMAVCLWFRIADKLSVAGTVHADVSILMDVPKRSRVS